LSVHDEGYSRNHRVY